MAGSSSDDDDTGRESRSKLLKRHKAEVLKAQKEGQRLGKKRTEEAAALLAQVTARHIAELAAFDATGAEATQQSREPAAAVAAVAATLAATSLPSDTTEAADAAGAAGKKPSKAQKRREQKSKEEAEREARIAEENSNMGPSSRVVEEAALIEKLSPMGLVMREIKADGHCLYRSVEDQLAIEQGGAVPSGKDYLSLRAAIAAHMRSRPEEYMPFVNDCDSVAAFEAYCAEIETTACWGGQLELRALCEVLRRRVVVFSAHLPTVEMGDDAVAGDPLRVAFLQHAFGLGEHYNSVALAAAGDKDDDALA